MVADEIYICDECNRNGVKIANSDTHQIKFCCVRHF